MTDRRDSVGNWPAMSTEQRVWQATVSRVPHKDRHVSYNVAVVPRIARRELSLPSGLASELERATLALERLDGATGLDDSLVPLLRAESSASSRIEQIEVGQRHVGRALEGMAAKRSAREVAANVAALLAAVDVADSSHLRVADVHGIHRTLMPEKPWAGELREVQSWIGGSDYSPRNARYVPPPPEQLAGLMDDLVGFIVREDLPSLAQAAIVHAQFECIHPYVDGNGRTGRALVHVVLRRRGVVTRRIAPLSLALVADRDTYFDGLVRYQRGDVHTWLAQFARAAQHAAAAGHELAARLTTVRTEWEQEPAVAGARSDAVIRRIVAGLSAHPVTDANRTAARYGVTPTAARAALNQLEDAGILRQVSVDRGLRVWEAHEVFAILDDVEREAGA